MTSGYRVAVLVTLILALSLRVQQSLPAAAGGTDAPGQASGGQDAQPPQPERPRFRGGANLVRLDAYVSVDGVPVTDLTLKDFEVLEDNVAQRLESFELIRPRGPAAQTTRREPNTVADAREMAADSEARLFVLFLDIWHVNLSGSYRAQQPIISFLDRAIGQDDMVGVMTPEMSARNLTLARRTQTIEGILKNNWFWGERDQQVTSDPRENDIRICYPDGGETSGIAEEMIQRRRERKVLDAIEDLIVHLEGIREERKFVLMLSSGWLLPGRNDSLGRVIDKRIPQGPRIGTGPEGKLTSEDPRRYNDVDSCDRERLRLASEDLNTDFLRLMQRANRANVSFYSVDPRGLVAFDSDLSNPRATNIAWDSARLQSRQTNLRVLAENTDGFAIINTNNLTPGLERIAADTSSYYLLGYYSTNTRLDGKYRKLTVRVKRPNVRVRARPGYLAPTEADAASSRVDALMNGAAPGHTTLAPGLARALERLTPTRGIIPVRVQATAGAKQIWVTSELDSTTLKSSEWQQGGSARIVLEHERGAVPAIDEDIVIEPGQQSISFSPKDAALAPGRYVIRLQLTPKGGKVPLQTTADVFVPEETALLSQTGLASRRGPSTGLQYQPTADARFRRTERLRVEVPRLSDQGTISARLLGRDGQPLNVAITLSERAGTDAQRFVVADVALAPLAQGEYLVEITLEAGEKKETTVYAFRLVP